MYQSHHRLYGRGRRRRCHGSVNGGVIIWKSNKLCSYTCQYAWEFTYCYKFGKLNMQKNSAEKYQFEVEILEKEDMLKLGMGAMLAVNQGST